jgi:hypothetical protein
MRNRYIENAAPVSVPPPKRAKGRPFSRSMALVALFLGIALAIYWVSDYHKRPHVFPKSDAIFSSSMALSPKYSDSPTRNSVPRAATYVEGNANHLSPDEREAFFDDISQVFGTIGVATVDAESMAPHLSKLNARGVPGLSAVVAELNEPPTTDPGVQQRIHLVDYLNYRMRWDPMAKTLARQIIETKVPEQTPLRYQAATIIEKSDMISGLAAVDWNEAADALRALGNSRLRRIALKSAFESLVDHGETKEEALAKIRNIDHDFVY